MSTTTARHPSPTARAATARAATARAVLATALAAALAATALVSTAGGAQASPGDDPAYDPAHTAATAPDRSSGCGAPAPQQPGASELRTITSGGRERSYQLHLPDGYRADRAWPVILVFHGRGNTGAGTEAFAGLDSLPAVVAYGNGVVGTGSGDRQAWEGAPYSAPGVDDVQYTRDLLDQLEASLCVDTRRVYATGKSNGAGFTGILACDLSDRIAAIAPVAGAFYCNGHPNCSPTRPVPVIDFHGTGDVTIPYAGDSDRGLPAIPDWVAAWAARNGCNAGPLTTRTAPDVTTSRWVGCKRGAEVTHVAVLGGGHTWPGEDSYSGGGYATHSIEASEVMWEFLRDERLPATRTS
jgi:polyhydroxybutyrate depolymerase